MSNNLDSLIRYLTEVRIGQRGFPRPRPELGGAPLTRGEVHDLDRVLPQYCEICLIERGQGRRLAAEHCRETGLIRGRACTCCNSALAAFRHSILLLEAAMKYLAEPPARAVLASLPLDPE